MTLGELLRDVDGHLQAGRSEDANRLVDVALSEHPKNCDLLNAKGAIRSAFGDYVSAISFYRRAIELSVSPAPYWNNLGTAFKSLRLYGMAIYCYEQSLGLDNLASLVHHNLGLCYADVGNQLRAIEEFTRAYDCDSNQSLAIWGRARSYLRLGLYQHGWRDFEYRIVCGLIPSRAKDLQRWDGSSYIGRKLLIFSEQGFGDTIWASRYLQGARSLGGELIVECQPQLVSLVEAMNVCDSVIPAGALLPQFDLVDYIGSLPGRFQMMGGCIDGHQYIRPQQWRRDRYKELFGSKGGLLKVGIVWSGNTNFKRNSDRALPLAALLKAVALPGVKLFSLQKGTPRSELRLLENEFEITDLDIMLFDFAETAAAVAELDLVIMTDSAVAHLAGALGKPVWLLLGEPSHWLWLENRMDSPWYSSMKIFRQSVEGDWNSALDRLGRELANLIGSVHRLQTHAGA